MRRVLIHVAAAALVAGVPVLAAKTPTFAALLANAARPAEDKARDADRKPAELMQFAGVKPGSKVSELAPGGGYFTRLLSLAVGPKGMVYAFSTRPAPAIEAWAASNPNTKLIMGTLATPLAPEPVDLVWTTLNYHDFKNNKVEGGDAAAKFNQMAFAALKPGGTYLVVDHEAAPGAGTSVTSTLHRIESVAVVREVEAAGFKLDGQSDLLRHPGDDKTKGMRDSDRGKTDQFVLRFKKPKKK